MLILGGAVLIYGRRLFWVSVAGIGFLMGATLASILQPSLTPGLGLAIALGLGILGAFLAVVVQKITIKLVGFLGFGYLLAACAQYTIPGQFDYLWAYFLGGGVLGLILIAFIFDWTLIIVSAFTGATLISQTLDLTPQQRGLSVLIIFAIGLIFQSGQMRSKKSNRKKLKRELKA